MGSWLRPMGVLTPFAKQPQHPWLVVQLLFLNLEGACVSLRRLGWPATHPCRNALPSDHSLLLPNAGYPGLVYTCSMQPHNFALRR